MRNHLAMLLVLSALSAAGAATNTQVQLEFKLVEAPRNWAARQGLLKPPSPVAPSFFDEVARERDVDLLSAPTIVTHINQEAEIRILESVEYFEEENEKYILMTLPDDESPGIAVAVNVSPVDGSPGIFRTRWEASINTVKERLPLKKGQLKVGRPVIDSKEARSTTDLVAGQWTLLAAMNTQRKKTDGVFLMFARPTEVKAESAIQADELPVEATADSVERLTNGVVRFKGQVRLDAGDYVLYADQLDWMKPDDASPGFRADSFAFESDVGRLRLEGNVRLAAAGGVVQADRVIVNRIAPEPAAMGELEKALRTWIVPSMEFRDAALRDVADYLRNVSRELDPEQQGVNIILKAKGEATITLSLRHVSFLDALGYITEVAGLKYRLDESAVVIE